MTIVAAGQMMKVALSAHLPDHMRIILETLSSSSKIGRGRALTML